MTTSTRPRRGEVWLVDFGDPIGRQQAGRRPAVVVSDDQMNAGNFGLVIVVPTTTRPRGLRTHVEIDAHESGLPDVSYAKCEDIRSISDERLVVRLGLAPLGAVAQIERVLRFLLRL